MTQNIIKSDIYQLAEIDGEMKIRDLDLAEKLGLKNPRDIKTIIKQNLDELQSFCSLSAMPTKVDIGLGLTRTVESFFLNEEQALLVCILSRTAKAKEVRRELIALYSQYRHGELEETNTRFLVEDLQFEILKSNPEWAKILRCHQAGLSGKEIGKVIGKSKDTVNRQLQRMHSCGFPVRLVSGRKSAQLFLPFGG
jgi:hypothetical protein|nr:MAG TPA: N BRO family, N-terminal domain [Caudoviricetes sp.]